MHTAQKLPISTYYLLLGQSFNLIGAVLSVTISAIVGLQLAPSYSLATVPYGLQFLAILMFTYVFSLQMKKHGRFVVFQQGAIYLMISGVLGYAAVIYQSFLLLCLCHFLLGMFIAVANFYRFAATDHMSNKELITKASSFVISGGVLAAIVAPFIAIHLQSVPPFAKYALCYAFFIPLGLLVVLINVLWKKSSLSLTQSFQSDSKNTLNQSTLSPSASIRFSSPIVVAVLAGSVGYFLMNLMMMQASMGIKTHHSFNDASYAIQMHVVAMFLPSFFASRLIALLSVYRYILLGFLLIAMSSVIVLQSQSLFFMQLSLVLLGVGWNFTYTGGSSLLAGAQTHDKYKIQGVNDTIIAFSATLGAFLPAPFLSHLGLVYSNYLYVVICLLSMIVIGFIHRKQKVRSLA